MITCESACPHRIPKENTASPATGLRWPQSPTRSVRRSSSTARKPFATRIPASIRRLPAIRTPSTTRSRPIRRSRCCACCAMLGSRADANSGGEIRVALRAGFTPADIVFTGVGKTRDELEFAVAAGRGHDQRRVARRARSHRRGRAGARPHGSRRPARQPGHRREDPRQHLHRPAHQQVRRRRSRRRAASTATRRGLAGLRFVGVHVHIGSQITSAEPLQRAAEALAGIALELRDDGVPLEHVDLGGGLGIPYEGKPMIAPSEYAAAVLPALRRCGLPVVLEPGRAIVGRSGALVSRIVDTKQNPDGRPLRGARRRDDRADAAGAVRLVPPHRTGAAARRSRPAPGTSSVRSARAAMRSAVNASCRRSRSATSWRCSTPAPMARDGLQLQPPAAGARGPRGRRRLDRHPSPADARRRPRARDVARLRLGPTSMKAPPR